MEAANSSRITILSGVLLLVLAVLPAHMARAAIVHLEAPGNLSQSNTTYMLDNDVSAPGTCFTISADNVVLDLGGHVVTYNSEPGDTVCGVLITWNRTNVKVTNGLLSQGSGNGYQSDGIRGQQARNVELDHLFISYQGDDNEGVNLNGGGYAQSANIHDNVVHPNGTKRAGGNGIITHYGDFAAISVSQTGGNVRITNNDIEGKGYLGIEFGYSIPLTSTLEITGNTIRMAAPVRDGYGIAISSGNNDNIGFEVSNNTIVQSSGRGILVEGYVSDSSPGPGLGTIHDNWMDVREAEDSGEYPGAPGASTGICLRFGAHNISVYDNAVVAWAGANAAPPQFPTQQGAACIARGLKIHSGVTGRDNNVYDNVVTVSTTDSAYSASAIVAINDAAVPGVNEIFHGNLALSNSFLVDLNCDEGSGSYQTFETNTFVKGENPQGFHSIRAGYWTGQAIGNVFLDNTWENGAEGDDLKLSSSDGAPYDLSTQWYLHETVTGSSGNTISGATVSATATGGGVETVTSTTDARGVVQLDLTDYSRSGITYPPISNYAYFTPHTVRSSAPGYPSETKTLTMITSQEVTVILDGSAIEPPAISEVAVSNVTQTTAVVSWQTDRPAMSRVDYGLDTSYGSTISDAALVSSHNLALTGLSPNTYHFRITAADSGGLQNQGADHSFVILAPLPSVPGTPVADFRGNPVSGLSPLVVSFQDLSSGAPTSWSWTFGDGDSSSVQSPVHTYASAGRYTVSLAVRNTYGAGHKTRPDYVVAEDSSGIVVDPSYQAPVAISRILPNPIATKAMIAFCVPAAGHVVVEVSDSAGRRVALLVDEDRTRGEEVAWYPRKLPAGMYFLRLSWKGQVRTRKLTIVR